MNICQAKRLNLPVDFKNILALGAALDKCKNMLYNTNMINTILRKVILMLCIAFAVVAFGFPLFVVPFGSYDGEGYETIADGTEIQYRYSYEFGFDGKVTYTKTTYDRKAELEKHEYYYKTHKNKIFFSEDGVNYNHQEYMTIASIIRLGDGSFNVYSCAVAIGVAVVAGALVLTAPNKRN